MQQLPPPKGEGFPGFFFAFREHMDTIEPELCQLFDNIFLNREYYENVDLSIDGHYCMLRRKYMNTHRRLYLSTGQGSEDINLFKGVFIKTLEDGIMLRLMMLEMLESNGLPRKLIEAKIRKYVLDTHNPRHRGLRAVYWYIHEVCISRWPESLHGMWAADCLLFGEMRCCSPNMVGMHALVLGVMMGVKQLHMYFPVELRRHETFTNPHFGNYFDFIGLQKPAVIPYTPKDVPYRAGDPL
ncbi:hypothetical protein BOX15_Mlig018863g2 [Macrostomum lignano]|uniref:Peptidylprolyl isomerase n=2 Tax=Macrostomum lignano TaxID=282301 RepID=A0A1I8HE49_9PLAT|nr:hypothetical protein BOX15_Mlig018863g2 [Macrostomum lignano]